jgi:D-beta-D-heptose 7-phosphate kinase/D-beta-D-heptose 1-phosphate adenosyltransferase
MEKLTRFIGQFPKQNILVIGDLMIDKFVWGKVSRISPEAPVPVLEVVKESFTLGGAGNVANNLATMGAMVHLVGVVGNDAVGDMLRDELRSKRIGDNCLVVDESRPTSIKTRIIASHQQVVRVDRELKGNFTTGLINRICARLEEIIPTVDAVIISDYGKGVISPPVLSKAIALARRKDIPVTVDPKIEHFLSYKKVTCITPNLLEAVGGMRIAHEISNNHEEAIYDLGKKILKKLNSDSVLITRGEKGMSLFESNGKVTNIPTRAREVYDVTGAGDTVISIFTLALAARAKLHEAAEISNFAAGIVVGKLGTATVSPEELHETIVNFKK